jgi:integrase/recombinase XerD
VALPLTAATTRDRFLIIRGKGGRERLVPLSEPARQAMAEYLAAVRAAADCEPNRRQALPPDGNGCSPPMPAAAT